MKIAIIIPAAGSGTRFGSALPKQYHTVHGVPILLRTITTALGIPNVISVIVALAPRDDHFEAMVKGAHLDTTLLHCVDGDVERQLSIRNALRHPSTLDASVILVHDAVRPLASADLFLRVASAASTLGAVVPVLPVTDTIKRVSANGEVIETVPRDDLRRIQTPQGFTAGVLREAYLNAERTGILGTDDASLVENAGVTVHTISGETWNIKVTTGTDITVAESLLES